MVDNKTGIIFAGNLIMDHYKKVMVYPEESTLTRILDVKNSPGGSAYSSTIDMARLDKTIPLKVIGVVGDDFDGHQILKSFDSYNSISTKRIRKKGITSYTDVFENIKNNTRTFFQYMGANAELDESDFDFSLVTARIIHVGYILLLDKLDEENDEYGTTLAKVLCDAKQNGIKTSIDIVSENSDRYEKIVKPTLRYVDYCIINEYEAQKTTNVSIRDNFGMLNLENCIDACRELFRYGVEEWVIIHSREGAVGMNRQEEIFVKNTIKMDINHIKSTTGAGDAFLAGALYSAYHDYGIEYALEMGIATACLSLLVDNPTDGVLCAKQARSFYNESPKEDWECFRIV